MSCSRVPSFPVVILGTTLNRQISQTSLSGQTKAFSIDSEKEPVGRSINNRRRFSTSFPPFQKCFPSQLTCNHATPCKTQQKKTPFLLTHRKLPHHQHHHHHPIHPIPSHHSNLPQNPHAPILGLPALPQPVPPRQRENMHLLLPVQPTPAHPGLHQAIPEQNPVGVRMS